MAPSSSPDPPAGIRTGRHTDRRDFLKALSGGVLAWPLSALNAKDAALPPPGAPAATEEALGQQIRDAFLLPADRIYLNNGTLGPQPRVVVQATENYGRRVAESFPPSIPWEALRDGLASLLGGDPEGFVIPRNTTEAMAVVAQGLPVGPGDQILTTDHEHIGGRSAWELLARRRGASLVHARLPVPARSADELLEAIWDRVTPSTRVVSVSHVLFTNGTILPVEALSARCRREGIVFVVDGAHPPGMMPVDIDAIAPDFYLSSPHKWLLAPQGTGLLWMAPRWRQRLWPLIPSGDWAEGGARRFDHVGTIDGSRMAGLLAALEFHQALGPAVVWDRVRDLQRHLRSGLAPIRGLEVRSPAPELCAGMFAFRIAGRDSMVLQRFLAGEARIRTRVIGEFGLGWMRLSTHVYNRLDELDRVSALISDWAQAAPA